MQPIRRNALQVAHQPWDFHHVPSCGGYGHLLVISIEKKTFIECVLSHL